MTVRDYIRERFLLLSLPAMESLIFDIESKLSQEGVSVEADMTHDLVQPIQIEFVKTLPNMLLAPQSISELGVSITTAKREDIISYYHSQCKALGIKDELIETETKTKKTPKIRFL